MTWRYLPHSTNVAAADIDGEDLIVQFKSGAVYRYAGAADQLEELLSASSPGGYINANLRDDGERIS